MPAAPSSMAVPTALFLSGKVVVEDGTPLTEAAGIQTICHGQRRTETHTDSHGGFSFQFGGQTPAMTADSISDADNTGAAADPDGRGGAAQGRSPQRDFRDCELQAVLAGFRSDSIELSSRLASMEGIEVGRIVLHRLGAVQGFTVSATSASAPPKAKKAYEKGLNEAKKGKWLQAEEQFHAAVQIYPSYAVAWLELGRVQLRSGNAAAGQQSFQRSLDADSKFVSPYEELALMAARQKDWNHALEITDKLIALNNLLPQAWFLNAAANYNLQKLDEAEKSAREGLKLDPDHRIPRMEFLLATILVDKRDFSQAGDHFRSYLELSPNADDAEAARKKLTEIDKESAAASMPSSPK